MLLVQSPTIFDFLKVNFKLKQLCFLGNGILEHAIAIVSRRLGPFDHRDRRARTSRRSSRGSRKSWSGPFRTSPLRIHPRRKKNKTFGKLNRYFSPINIQLFAKLSYTLDI